MRLREGLRERERERERLTEGTYMHNKTSLLSQVEKVLIGFCWWLPLALLWQFCYQCHCVSFDPYRSTVNFKWKLMALLLKIIILYWFVVRCAMKITDFMWLGKTLLMESNMWDDPVPYPGLDSDYAICLGKTLLVESNTRSDPIPYLGNSTSGLACGRPGTYTCISYPAYTHGRSITARSLSSSQLLPMLQC